MLLTSSQVSVAVSSGVVVLFTSALFFSGYALQQKTLNDLRRAIREPPPEPPKIFLPDRFNAMTTELEDGSIVVLNHDAEGNILETDNGQEQKNDQTIVEVTPTAPGSEDQPQQQQPQQPQQQTQSIGQQPVEGASLQQEKQTEPQGQQQTQETAQQSQGTNVEPQQEVNKAATPQEVPQAPEAPQDQAAQLEATKPEKPLSKAERRRKIKEELMESSHFTKPMVYQRRLY